mgnify:CR=1 FL=1
MNNDELRKRFGVTGEQLDAWADEYEGADWSHMRFGEVIKGRSRISDEPLDSITVRIPTDLSERYNRLAKETGRSRSYYVNEALADSIDRFEYEYGILKDIEDYRAGRLETYSIDEVKAHCGLAD